MKEGGDDEGEEDSDGFAKLPPMTEKKKAEIRRLIREYAAGHEEEPEEEAEAEGAGEPVGAPAVGELERAAMRKAAKEKIAAGKLAKEVIDLEEESVEVEVATKAELERAEAIKAAKKLLAEEESKKKGVEGPAKEPAIKKPAAKKPAEKAEKGAERVLKDKGKGKKAVKDVAEMWISSDDDAASPAGSGQDDDEPESPLAKKKAAKEARDKGKGVAKGPAVPVMPGYVQKAGKTKGLDTRGNPMLDKFESNAELSLLTLGNPNRDVDWRNKTKKPTAGPTQRRAAFM